MITIRSRRGLFLVILLLLTACRQVESNSPITPTPFQETLPRHRISSTEPIAISLAHLAANPEFFEGSTLQLAGEYQKLPILSCKRDPHPGPASWGIVGDGLLANASGQDAQLRSLLAKNQWIVAEGRWLHYVGPVGCGKSAPVQEVWYLSVNRILEPHPLARAGKEFLPENGAPTPISEMPDNADVPGSATDDGLLNSSGGEATASPSFLATNTPEQSISPTTNPVEATITPSFNPNESPSPSVTADFNTPDVSETPTLTTTVTVTPGPTPTPSLTPEGLSFNNRGPIDFEDLKNRNAGFWCPRKVDVAH